MEAKLSVGDVVKCSIKKITYFGIFVEVILSLPLYFYFILFYVIGLDYLLCHKLDIFIMTF